MPRAETRRSPYSISIPRQHGAWSMLIASYVLGVACAPAWSPASLVLLVATVLGFMARHAATTAARLSPGDERRLGVWGWAAGYAAVAGIAVAVLMLGFGLWGLVPIGIAVAHFVGFSAAMERKRLDRTLLGELLGTIGLTLVVPAAAYVCTGTLDLRTWALFILATAFFFSAVFHVRYLTRSRSERFQGRGARLRAAVPSLAVHAAAFVATAVLSGTGLLPPLAPVVVLPVVAKAVYAAVVQPSGFPPRPSWTRMAGATPRPGTLSGPASSPSASVLAWWDPSWPSSQRDICGAGVY